MNKSATVTAKPDTLGKSLLPSIATGQAAGLIMAVVAMLVFAVFLQEPLYPVQVIGGPSSARAPSRASSRTPCWRPLLHQPARPWAGAWVFWLAASSLSIDASRTPHSWVVIGIVSMVGPYLLVPAALKSLARRGLLEPRSPAFLGLGGHIVLAFLWPLLIEGRLAR